MKHIVTSRWILSNLKVSLKHHVAYIDNLVVEETYFQGKDNEDLEMKLLIKYLELTKTQK